MTHELGTCLWFDKKAKDAFYFSHVVGSRGIDVDISNVISHLHKNIDQFTTPFKNDLKMTTQEQAEYNQLLTYRNLTKSMMLLNVMNIQN
jgi:hypothetical protein